MNRLITTLTALLILVLISTCGQKTKETTEAISALKSIAKAGENMEKDMDRLEKKQEERRQKGDTLAMHYEELAKFLPSDIVGFEINGDLDGNSTNMMGMSYSNVRQTYVDVDGYVLTIEIMDYNFANSMYMAATAIYGVGMEIDNTEQRLKSFTLSEDVKGWEVLKKKKNKASVFVGIAGRFFISIEADGQEDTDLVKEILDGLDLDQLAKL